MPVADSVSGLSLDDFEDMTFLVLKTGIDACFY